MGKADYVDFQDRTKPLGYLITFRCYGTWLHGDGRGSIDRRNYNRYGTPDMPANPKLLNDENAELRHRAMLLSNAQRQVVELAIREVCDYRDYLLHAVNVRTNHVHSVVSAPCNPEHRDGQFQILCNEKVARGRSIGPKYQAVGAARKHTVSLD